MKTMLRLHHLGKARLFLYIGMNQKRDSAGDIFPHLGIRLLYENIGLTVFLKYNKVVSMHS